MIYTFLMNQHWLDKPVFIIKFLDDHEKYYVLFTKDWSEFYSLYIEPTKKKYWTTTDVGSTSIDIHYHYLETFFNPNTHKIVLNDIVFYP